MGLDAAVVVRVSDALNGPFALPPTRVPGYFLRPDYFELLADLRRDAPVHEYAPGMRTVTRYDDIRAISRDPERFCSAMGVLVNDPLRTGGRADPARSCTWIRPTTSAGASS